MRHRWAGWLNGAGAAARTAEAAADVPPAMHRNVIILAVCQAFFITATSAIVVSAGLIGHSLAETKALATLPLGAQFGAMMIATMPASLLMRRIGRRDGFTVGAMIGLAGALVAMKAVLDGDFALFCLGSALIGAFNGFAQYYRFAAADAANEAFKSRAISYVLAGGVIASVGPLFADFSKDMLAPIPFAGVYVTVAVFYLATLVALRFVTIPPPAGEERTGRGRSLSEIMRQPVFIVAALAGIVSYAMMSLVMTATPLAMKYCGLGFSDSATVLQWHVFGMFAPAFFSGQLIKRFGTLNVMAAGAIIIALCAVANLQGIGLANFWAGGMLLGIGWNFLFVGATTLVTEAYTPAEKAKTQAANDFLVFGSVAAAALLSGVLHETVGWQAMNYAVLPFIGLVLAAIIWLGRVRRHEAALSTNA